MLQTVIGITHFQTGVNWHFRSVKDRVLNIDLAQLCESDYRNITSKIKSLVAFSPCAHTNLIIFAKTSPLLSIRDKAGKQWSWRVLLGGFREVEWMSGESGDMMVL